MKYRIYIILACIFLFFGCPYENIGEQKSPEIILGELPLKIGTFVAKDEIHTYESKELGASQIFIATYPFILADVYIFDLGYPIIPDGIESDIIEQAYRQAQADIMDDKSKGNIANCTKLSDQSTDIVLDNNKVVRLLSSFFSFDLVDDDGLIKEKIYSDLYLVGKRNHLIKVRVTYPNWKKELSKSQIYELLKKIFSIYDKKIP